MTGRDESGATAVEYALLLTFIVAVLIGTVVFFGIDVADLYSSVPDF